MSDLKFILNKCFDAFFYGGATAYGMVKTNMIANPDSLLIGGAATAIIGGLGGSLLVAYDSFKTKKGVKS
jgi:hypothetical protein